MTCAPASARREEQNGAATACSTVITVIPSSGSMAWSHVLRTSFIGEPVSASPGHALVGAGHAEHMLGDIGKNEIGRDRRDLIEPRFAELAFDIIFLGKAETAVGLDAGVRGLPRGIGGKHLRHVGLGAAVE